MHPPLRSAGARSSRASRRSGGQRRDGLGTPGASPPVDGPAVGVAPTSKVFVLADPCLLRREEGGAFVRGIRDVEAVTGRVVTDGQFLWAWSSSRVVSSLGRTSASFAVGCPTRAGRTRRGAEVRSQCRGSRRSGSKSEGGSHRQWRRATSSAAAWLFDDLTTPAVPRLVHASSLQRPLPTCFQWADRAWSPARRGDRDPKDGSRHRVNE